MQTVKACTKCGEVKPLDGFHKDKRKRDGRQPHCKECVSEHHRRYREENREEMLERQRRYWKENRGKGVERQRRYWKENREKELERQRRYREENREVFKAKILAHRAADQELSKLLSSVPPYARWNEEEDAILMADDGMTIYEKAIHLGRTYKSCSSRRQKIKKTRRITNV